MALRRFVLRVVRVLRTLPGRLFILSSGLLIVIAVLRATAGLPEIIDVFRKVVRLAWFVSLAWLLFGAIMRGRRRWLWAVRRKLILSYIFLGVVPVALIILFVLTGGLVVYNSLAAYLFTAGYERIVEDVARVAETAANEIAQNPKSLAEVVNRKYSNLSGTYPALSITAIRARPKDGPEIVTAGAWRHLRPPTSLPAWINDQTRWKGTLGVHIVATDDSGLVIRSMSRTANGNEVVVVDLPVNADVVAKLHDVSGAHMGEITLTSDAGTAAPIVGLDPVVPNDGLADTADNASLFSTLFRRSFVLMDFQDWTKGTTGRVSIRLEAPVWHLYDRIAAAQEHQMSGKVTLSFILLALGTFLLIVQVSALALGAYLARAITSSVHFLFEGTARIGQGDFTHRIPIVTNDQLGDLAGSFNNMGASIEHLRHIEREKLRLDEELQIARKIQRSLLPTSVPQIAGLGIADLCEPAQEVGGDYYDFFVLGPRQLGVLVADVSGKGTSAALYMAELKGLVLALSRIHRSPRTLLIELNDLLAEHLDNRSFITMTYAIVDLDEGTLTCARAGHTPLLIVSGGESQVVIPDGMVLGLRLPGAHARFDSLLKEHTQRIHPGDVVVLYTDGITEAMNGDGDLFGDTSLARVTEAHHTLPAAGIRERILRDVKAFVGDADPHDDMTMVVLKIEGAA